MKDFELAYTVRFWDCDRTVNHALAIVEFIPQIKSSAAFCDIAAVGGYGDMGPVGELDPWRLAIYQTGYYV